MAKGEIHKYGTDDGWHGVVEKGGEFPPEKDRYHLYIGQPLAPYVLFLSKLLTRHRSLLPVRPPRKPRSSHQAS